MIKLLFLAGSSRKESLNKKLALYASKMAEEHEAVDVQFLDLADFDMPIYNGDFEDEHGLPDNAIRLKKLFMDCDGFFLACPEYNSSFTPLLKNSMDWISRPNKKDDNDGSAFQGKICALGSVSPGPLGGIRGLFPVRMWLSTIGVNIIPAQVCVNNGMDAFKGDDLVDGQKQKMLGDVINQFIETTKKLNA